MLNVKEIALPVEGGALAGIDFGGQGQGVLLVHGSGHNAAAWVDVAARLVEHCHPVAFDMRGHGWSEPASTGPEQYWRDLADVVTALGWRRPVLVGHSTGGYAVTAAAASGLVEPEAICVVDGPVLDDRATAAAELASWTRPEGVKRLREVFRYGWRVGVEEMREYIERCVRDTATDPLNAGARPALVREVTRRSFRRHAEGWVRRPTIEEIVTVAAPDPAAPVYPSVDVYERVGCPLTIVLAEKGHYAERRAEAQAVVEAAPGRVLVDIAAAHNVPMTSPAELAAIILDLVPGTGVRLLSRYRAWARV